MAKKTFLQSNWRNILITTGISTVIYGVFFESFFSFISIILTIILMMVLSSILHGIIFNIKYLKLMYLKNRNIGRIILGYYMIGLLISFVAFTFGAFNGIPIWMQILYIPIHALFSPLRGLF